MPDRFIPPRWRTVLRVIRATLYTLVAGAGIAATVLTPTTIAGTIGEPLMYWWASLATVGALTALWGVIADRYRIEWVASWPATGGTLVYAATVWGLVAQGESTRSTQAFIVTALTVALAYRGVELAAHAAKLRADHHRGK